VEAKRFQKTVLESFTRLETGQAELKEDIKFVHEDLNSEIVMIATAIKALVAKMATKEEYEKRLIDLENRIRVLEQKIGQ
jgi:hypothetical protein